MSVEILTGVSVNALVYSKPVHGRPRTLFMISGGRSKKPRRRGAA
ncbi:hypothetical protein AIOL_003464 [Candidatus Rhodobacter oscarellae]|uniref:Uncharacterized protein n=1 Tax=Candidatus Rhodobacter oscarellae TaxID=1675527 RepID=A0A0J9E9Z2_9RHOB|nr:hypothetical protein AIOL_003464 [Candidatus Rhodobacter lobularis]